MARFHYKALTLDGREIAGEAEAADEAALADALAGAGGILTEAREQKTAGSWRALFTLTIDAAQVTTFLTELAMLLRGGQRIDEALALLGEGRKGGLAGIIRAVRSDILSGLALADAFAAHPAAFPPDVVALLRVADSTGRLDRAVDAAATQRLRGQALAEKLGAALRYPAFLFVTAIGVLIFFLTFVIPQFTGIIRDSGSKPDWAISTAITLSDALNAHIDALKIGAVALALAIFAVMRVDALKRPLLGLFARLPVVAGILELRLTALFCLTLATLIGQGVTVPRALKVLGEVAGERARPRLERIGDAVRRGTSLADALEQENFLPAIARRMLRIGEESGELEPIAAQAGQLYERKLEQRLDRVTAIIGPVAILTIAGLIGGLMVTIMTALINVNQMVA
ncbi:hypothetical protein BJF93_12830 [Xaviernesmea oryzae]|uniref:Type II secretion system protein GspF domain-containing protein n=1 Tax=Xaviernesmea oryzae TaxID=464029 RepID=A0A1Q9AQM9_9HYPH|nr:type II secretion system F family protein [Xaviernesmea oryzae]OLP57747.1 hypothetical protein BJF93_12830 [Xaviernesmea oryzae]SEM06468.1 general secretion pathway protein F [Xaviernesmea oryzae]